MNDYSGFFEQPLIFMGRPTIEDTVDDIRDEYADDTIQNVNASRGCRITDGTGVLP